ncbi:MAG: response regulator [Gammaproteobacteria bacterium]|nr:response regulator [Gammaproteobacteria bacterium]
MSDVLIIDDEGDVRDALALVLGRAGFDVRSAEDGESGIEACREHLPDVIITDMIMPKLDGAQLIRQIKSEQPTAKIVAISGGGHFGPAAYQPSAITTHAFLAAATAAGADRVLTKPFDAEDIVEAVRSLLPDPDQQK